MRYTRSLTRTLWISVFLLAACSKDEHQLPVAKVETRVITLGEFERAINAVGAEFLPSTTELPGLVEFLQKMIDKQILALKADELGYDKDPKVLEGMELFKASGLQAGYLKVKVVDKLKVPSDEDLKEAYDNYGLVYQVKQILTDTEEEGLFVCDLLQQGHDFESVCKEYSRGPDAAEGGRQIAAVYGQFPPHFQEALFSTKVGGITKPIQNPYGFFVIKVISRNQPPQKPFEELKSMLERRVLYLQELKLTTEMSDRVREKYGFELYDDNLEIILDAMPPDRPIENPIPRDLEIYPLLDLAVGDFDKPVATYLGKTITIKDFSDLYDRADYGLRPRREFRLGGIRKFLVDLAMAQLIEEELATSGIENEPQVARMLHRKQEELMVNVMYFDLIDKHTVVEYEEVQKYYDDNIEHFHSDERRRFQIILTGDKATADLAKSRVTRGTILTRVAADYATDEEIADTGLNDVLITRGETPEIDTYGFALKKEGDISEPFQITDGWVVAKLVEIRPAGYVLVSEAQHEINHELKQRKNDERLNELIIKWKPAYDVTIYEKNLKKAVVTARTTGATGDAHAGHPHD